MNVPYPGFYLFKNLPIRNIGASIRQTVRRTMARYRGPKNRIARKFGANIFGRRKNPLATKSNPPGMHGAKRKKRSDFGNQLHEKQKLASFYGVVPLKTLSRYYKEALRKEGNTSDLFIQQLESRLDVVVYRMKFAPTIFSSQQLVSHGHVLVNGRKVNIRSYQVKPNDVVTLKEKTLELSVIKDSLASSRELPAYVSFDSQTNKGSILILPSLDQVSFPLHINVPVVCEYLAYTS